MTGETTGFEPRAKALGEVLAVVFGAYLFASVVVAAVNPTLVDAGVVTPGQHRRIARGVYAAVWRLPCW